MSIEQTRKLEEHKEQMNISNKIMQICYLNFDSYFLKVVYYMYLLATPDIGAVGSDVIESKAM